MSNLAYSKFADIPDSRDMAGAFKSALDSGKITQKENDLWHFVLTTYGNNGFSTKELERDFRNAAYATIRGFVMKFTELGLLTERVYGNRKKYMASSPI